VSTNGAPIQQITGLASGLDTNTIISELMSIERQPLVSLQQKQTIEKARQSDLQKIQTQLQALSSAIASLRDTSVWGNTQTVSASDPTKLSVTRTGFATTGAFTFNVTQLAKAAQWTQQSNLTAAKGNSTLTITVGSSSVNVAVLKNDSIDTIASKINATSGTPVYATTVNGKLVLSGLATGAANDISISSTGSLKGDLSMQRTITPQDLTYTIDGGAVQTSPTDSVTNAMAGLNVQFLSLGSSTVTVNAPAPDTTAIQNKIQSFVTTYNQTVDMIYQKLNEQKVVNPQSDADRVKGDLQGDPGLTSLLSQLRKAVGDVFSGQPVGANVLSEAGLSTGAAVGSGTLNQDALEGKLTLDAATLSTALATNFTAVKQMFSNVTGAYATEGLSQRLDGIVNPWTQTGGLLDSRLKGEASTLKNIQDQQDALNVRLNLKQAALQQQFASLETALSQSQSEGSWLSSQIAGLGANG
jgi:flagellar hook-associated protein 2